MGMRFKKHSDSLPTIIIIPMIDIMFFLLVFFMLGTINMRNVSSVPVNLAAMQEAKLSDAEGIFITLNEKGDLFIGDTPVEKDAFIGNVQYVLKQNPNALVILRADKQSRYDDLSGILDKLKKSGVKRVALAAEMGR